MDGTQREELWTPPPAPLEAGRKLKFHVLGAVSSGGYADRGWPLCPSDQVLEIGGWGLRTVTTQSEALRESERQYTKGSMAPDRACKGTEWQFLSPHRVLYLIILRPELSLSDLLA